MTRKKYTNATIRFVIGLVLLGASWAYLNEHPAEKSSLMSGVDVIAHRWDMRIGSIQGKNTEEIKQQYNIERYANEMMYLAKNSSGCADEMDSIKKLVDEVSDLDPSEMESKGAAYRGLLGKLRKHLEGECVDEDETK